MFTVTPGHTIKHLQEQVRLIRGSGLVISSNMPVRADGMPYANAAERSDRDPGVAIYFYRDAKQVAMARDAFKTPLANLRSLGLALEGLRQLERHGGGVMSERAFQGFAALPPPDGASPTVISWRDLLGPFPDGLGSFEVLAIAEARYRQLAHKAHPDMGGSAERMAALNAAIAQARTELRS
jgi:hypothetical protein